MIQVLYNPLSNNGRGKDALKLPEKYPDFEFKFQDITQIEDIKSYVASLPEKTQILLTGGDGTINRFVNDFEGKIPPFEIFYYPLGSGNDFFNDMKDPNEKDKYIVRLNPFIENLPIVTVKGKSARFLNGIGYGLDGYAAEEADRRRKKSDKKINYTTIALKGLLYDYKPANATVTVDGVTRKYKKVFLAPTMKGRFFGGGMMITPHQDRLAENEEVSVGIVYKTSRLNLLRIFPQVFKGTHSKYTKIFDVRKGHDVKIVFDRPTALQIDGETVRDVLEYSVHVPIKETVKV